MELHFTTILQNNLAKNLSVASEPAISSDEAVVKKLLQQNLQYDDAFQASLYTELTHFLQFTASMLMAFPVGLYIRKRIRKNKRLNYILQFKELLQVRNNIEKGSFAYDTILFHQSPIALLKNKSHLANLVCLAILFGDEFIDGIAAVYGKQNIRQLLNDRKADFYLHYKNTIAGHEIYYAFDICSVLPQVVLESTNEKYGITYKAFYSHLQFLLQEMNRHLNQLGEEQAKSAATLICQACNKCFDTYQSDINEFNEDYSLTELLRYQKTKDDDIIQVLLALRAVLLNKDQLQYQKQFGSWSSMVRSMQLYDDMQDVSGDCDFQMNIVCYFAKNYFIREWQWLQEHKEQLQKTKGMQLHGTISMYMPASCIMTMQYARNIAQTRLCWVQQKIQNYLWRKNWLGFNNSLLKEKAFCFSVIMNMEDANAPLKLQFIQEQVMAIDHDLISADMKWAHICDLILMDEELKKYLFKKISRKQRYFLTSCFIEFPVAQKAAWVKAILNIK